MKTLSFIPGTMCDARVWAPVRQRLADRFETAYLPIETQLTRAGMMAVIENAQAPLNLVAFSMGGYLALTHALKHPGRVASLIVVGSSPFSLSDAELAQRRRAVDYLSTHPYAGATPGRLAQFVHPSRRSDPAVIDIVRAMDLDLGHDVVVAQLKETSVRIDLSPRLGELSCPVLVIGADSDPFVPLDTLYRMHALIPGSRIAEARDAGHMIPLEQPDWLARQIADFYGE